MNAVNAVIRLWVFGTVFWLGFWGWRDIDDCIRTPSGILFCPAIGMDVLRRTDLWHVAYSLLGPPLLALAGGLFFWWVLGRLRLNHN